MQSSLGSLKHKGYQHWEYFLQKQKARHAKPSRMFLTGPGRGQRRAAAGAARWGVWRFLDVSEVSDWNPPSSCLCVARCVCLCVGGFNCVEMRRKRKNLLHSKERRRHFTSSQTTERHGSKGETLQFNHFPLCSWPNTKSLREYLGSAVTLYNRAWLMGLIMPFLLIKASISVSLALSTLSLFHLYIVLSFSLPHTDKALEPQRSSQRVASKNILCTIISLWSVH